MSDNTTRPATSGGDTIADLDGGASKTQVMRVANRTGLVSRTNPLPVVSASTGAMWQRFIDQYARRIEQGAELDALLQQRLALTPHAPILFDVSPGTGSLAGGTTVIIAVDNSTGCTGGTVGGVALTSFAIVDARHVAGVTGAHAAGLVQATVTNATGTSAPGGVFTYASTAFTPASGALTSWFEDATDFGGGNWPSNPSAGTSGSRPALTLHNSQPTVSATAYNGHHPPAFDGVSNDFWGTPTGSILMSDLVSASYGEIHFLIDTDGPLAAAAANPYDDANPWSDGAATLTIGFGLNNPGTGPVASAYVYDGTTYNITPAQTFPVGVNRGRVIWDGVNLTSYICTAGGASGTSSIASGPAGILTGSLTLGTARTLWWGPGRILSFLTANAALGTTFDANLVAYWNAKYGLSLV